MESAVNDNKSYRTLRWELVMALLSKDTLAGFVPAVVTPFAAGGEIMEDSFAQIVEWTITNGAQGICVAGDNGESWALSAEERRRLIRIAVETAADRVPVIAGASAASSSQTISYACAAVDAGADAILLLPQIYVLKATRDELVRRFELVAKAVNVPIIAYNSPRRTGIELSPDDLQALTDAAPVVGVKESSRDFFHHSHILQRFRERLAFMVGPCHYILPGIALGARGFIATGPEFLGADASRLMKIGQQAPDAVYRLMHHKLTVIYQTLMSIGTWPAALKAGLQLIGQPAGIPRDPVLPLTPPDLDRLRQMFAELELLRQ